MKHFINCLIGTIFLGNIYAVMAQEQVIAPKMPIDEDSKLITYTEVVNQEGTKDELYNRGIMWFNSYYKNPQGVTKVRDKENGKIEGIARFRVYDIDKDGNKLPSSIISYTIKMDFKDGKYRYTITKLNVKGASRFPLERWLDKKDPTYHPKLDSYLVQIDETIRDLMRKMKEGMKPKVEKKDDW